MSVKVETLFDDLTYTLTYIVYDEQTKDAVVIDSVWDYDQASSSLTQESLKKVTDFVDSNGLNLHYILETHAHADHLTASQLLKEKYPNAKVAIGDQITKVQSVFKTVFNMPEVSTQGVEFDELLKDGDTFKAGTIEIKVLNTPGHTPACVSFLVNNEKVFAGDTMFMPDFGVGRCDFPEGSAEQLYDSITQKLYTLDDSVELYTGHDYQPGGRELKYKSTIGEQKKENIQLKAHTTKEEFVKFRTERDAKLNAPKLLLPSIQVNILAGKLPNAENNGTSYIKLPLTNKE
jgi:glyoxylase-like metal-dependent hydrolase (beta-lactamase superfamily II)